MSRSSLVVLCLAACVCVLAATAVSADCGIGGISLTPLSTVDYSAYTESSNGLELVWSLSVCGPSLYSRCTSMAGPQTSACQDTPSANTVVSYGDWTTDLWHKWSFMDPNNPANGIQLYMQGTAAPAGCNAQGTYSSWSFFPCAQVQGNLTVVQGSDCTANFTIPTPLTCREPLDDIATPIFLE